MLVAEFVCECFAGLFAETESPGVASGVASGAASWLIGGGAGIIVALLATKLLDVLKSKGVDLPELCRQQQQVFDLVAKREGLKEPPILALLKDVLENQKKMIQKQESLQREHAEIAAAIKAAAKLEELRD